MLQNPSMLPLSGWNRTPERHNIEPDSFYADSVVWLTDFQVVPGCTTELFCPTRAATRAEAALFIHGIATRPHTWGTDTTPFPQTISSPSTP